MRFHSVITQMYFLKALAITVNTVKDYALRNKPPEVAAPVRLKACYDIRQRHVIEPFRDVFPEL